MLLCPTFTPLPPGESPRSRLPVRSLHMMASAALTPETFELFKSNICIVVYSSPRSCLKTHLPEVRFLLMICFHFLSFFFFECVAFLLIDFRLILHSSRIPPMPVEVSYKNLNFNDRNNACMSWWGYHKSSARLDVPNFCLRAVSSHIKCGITFRNVK